MSTEKTPKPKGFGHQLYLEPLTRSGGNPHFPEWTGQGLTG